MILLLSDDLLDASKTLATARAEGIVVVQCKTPAALIARLEQQPVACCIVDLQCPGFDIAGLWEELSRSEPRPRVVAYGSHVDTARLKAAREAGCDEVMPRSKFFEEMPGRIRRWGSE